MNKFSFAAKRIGRAKNYKVWKDGFHPIILDLTIIYEQKLDYIHMNPVLSGFVVKPEFWVNSSYNLYTDDYEYCGDVRVDVLEL